MIRTVLKYKQIIICPCNLRRGKPLQLFKAYVRETVVSVLLFGSRSILQAVFLYVVYDLLKSLRKFVEVFLVEENLVLVI